MWFIYTCENTPSVRVGMRANGVAIYFRILPAYVEHGACTEKSNDDVAFLETSVSYGTDRT